MNKDPLEELFGSLDDTPEPVPARERLAHEQAERVRTAQLPAERSATRSTSTLPRDEGSGRPDRSAQAKPWIIVGIVAVVAILASIIVLNMARGDDSASPTTAPTSSPSASTKPTTTAPAKPTTEKPETEKPDEDTPPVVDVGATSPFPITQWGASSQWPGRLGSASYALSGADNAELRLTGELFDSFPESCSAMRQEWGATRLADGSFEVAKPATKCEAAPELYDEVWGLLHAWTETIKAN